VLSSTVTATPQGSTAPVLTTTVSGSKTGAVVGPLEPSTTYLITVVSANRDGSSPQSDALTFTSQAASVPPSAPTRVSAFWTSPGAGAGDSIVASWAAAKPGNSPVDEYQVTIRIYDGDTTGSFSQIVSGSSLTATFTNVEDIDSWSVQVRAHNAAGWGPWSARYILGGT
jgi:Fibronectin type III domain